MSSAGCSHQTLSSNRVATVQRCVDCGSLSVHVGPLTFRLDAASYEGLVAALTEARLVLHREQALEQGHFSSTRGQA
ncbi:MAG: hypothetical protein SFW67_11530 [Myxococcaceae bacterium]|nr:hypothetical protein [Myxococcaceae bacterium]